MNVAVYRRLSPSLQRAVRRLITVLPPAMRLGPEYRRTLALLGRAEAWTAEELAAWRLRSLQLTVSYAWEHVLGYRRLYEQAGVTPTDIRSLDDIRRLPFVTKELIRDHLGDFTSRVVPRGRRLHRTTGGSTGIPFGFFLLERDIQREYAFLHRAWEDAGWRVGERSAVLRGAFIGSEEHFFEHDPLLNNLLLSTYFLTSRSYPRFRSRILEMRAAHLQAYPSAATILADLVREHDDVGRLGFRVLLLGSENLYSWQREQIASAFPAARICSWYGHAEQVVFAPQCPAGTRLHLHPVYGETEILDPAGRPVPEGGIGELVGTSFWNRATPFIRYRTMDFAVRGAGGCEACGRPWTVLDRIDGRLQEFIVSRDGRYISMTQINMHSDVFDHVRQFQFHQREPGRVELRLVRRDGYGEEDTRRIHAEVGAKLGADMSLALAFVDDIPPLPSGKHCFLQQELPLRYGDHGHR